MWHTRVGGTGNSQSVTDAARIDKQEKLDRAADALRRKFGGAAVTRATLLSPDTRKPEALSAAKEREKDKK